MIIIKALSAIVVCALCVIGGTSPLWARDEVTAITRVMPLCLIIGIALLGVVHYA